MIEPNRGPEGEQKPANRLLLAVAPFLVLFYFVQTWSAPASTPYRVPKLIVMGLALAFAGWMWIDARLRRR